ncbi:MAG: ECF transporter S component [Thomasclavelia sp.]|nr:ECF transporter S component [Thomasclavelia sp.]
MKNSKVFKLTVTALMAALAYVSFTFLQIKIVTPGGVTSFHLGNAFVLLAALIVGGVPGGIAGAIGMGIGDLLDPIYITYAPKTIILKFMIGVVTGLVDHKLIKVNELEGKKLYLGVILSCTAGMLFNIVGEPLFGYFYTSVILGASSQAALALASYNFMTTIVNAILSIIIASTLYVIIKPRIEHYLSK